MREFWILGKDYDSYLNENFIDYNTIELTDDLNITCQFESEEEAMNFIVKNELCDFEVFKIKYL